MNASVQPPPSPSLAGPRPLQLVDGNVLSILSAPSSPSPLSPGLSTPPPSARKFHPSRRQSSISYFPSDHTPSWDLRSPTSATSRPSSLKRSTSLNHKLPGPLDLQGNKRSSLPLTDPLGSPQVEQRPPLTLTEKHADLLRFIAQKESKCLELRSQLAAHEAELAQLKRKWERIVSRGMDRAYSQQPASAAASSNSLLTGAVKDVSRLLAAGLSDLAASPSGSPNPASTSFPAHSAPPSAFAKHGPPVLALETGGRALGHANSCSTSTSTSTSASSSGTGTASSSVRLSQSSASSLAFDEPLAEQDEGAEAEDHAARAIRVDGGTGIESPVQISPASAIKAAKLHRRKSREVPAPALAPTSSSPGTSRATVAAEERKAKRASMHGGVPPAASIPGLSPLASGWMESVGSTVGKRWGEIQKGETFTKSQKRASLLLSDAASSFFAALAPTTPTGGAHTPVSVSSNPFGAALSPLGASPTAASAATSLLELDDEGAGALGSVLVPDRPALAPSRPAPAAQSKSLLDDDDDEWNW
ncbi:uncharacterized protein BXZ73DRAFT_42131 [Epithele typhae]|uniref:uncharacterized protein n=1 Tax=Epithele typhae TaxID=378194 RepID=UPI00200817AD|nr:uncharacterized protein BXZ73DRAFT_42131 [Epithele typhae]KAH9941238.1 hypothetical protein BXZ73DRAFT_42131 [Epithele typhae]